MNAVRVNASKEYDVLIGKGRLSLLGSETAKIIQPGKAVIVSDSNVWPLYGECASNSLRTAGFAVTHYVIPAGEESKCGTVYLELLNFLAENHITRSDCLIALGGGVIGDLTGFTAATYLRGIRYIQVPTTLLAAVDSSVGGKTAIDLPAGKNLAGAFCQPSLVLCDIDTLSTLPENVFRDGCAEVIKYGVLYDAKLFEHLTLMGPRFDRETVITRCVELKRDVVAEDEFDTGPRQKLNLGHTVGHGIEAHSHFTVSHGSAVAAGMAIVARASAAWNLCDGATAEQITGTLTKFQLPTTTSLSSDELYRSTLSDKKRSGGNVNLIVPKAIGNCIIYPLSVDQIKSFIEAGL